MIYGKSGTGKELVAKAIHGAGNRSGKPFIAINCAAMPDELLESELFGYVKGAFTGATGNKDGLFKAADGGTLFLDEVGETSPRLQAKLLRVLQDFKIQPLGTTRTFTVDVRIIGANNVRLQELVENGKFREDLYHRLKIFELYIPPLKKRIEDIPILAHYFLSQFSEQYNKSFAGFSPEALNILMRQDWPGNVRMLKNMIEKIAVFSNNPLIRSEQEVLALSSGNSFDVNIPKNMHLQDYLDFKEREFIEHALMLSEGKKQAAADMIGIDRATLWRKMQKYNIFPD
jgi:transcriptional regulator with PAS, ATPase and Fis domain